jgi:hypothetical protein
MITGEGTAIEPIDPSITEDSEQQYLPSQGPDIEAAHAFFIPEEEEESQDITKIISHCLKDAKKYSSGYVIKATSDLISVSEYIKLCAQHQKNNSCKQPCLSASMAIACHMGKGPYFARWI